MAATSSAALRFAVCSLQFANERWVTQSTPNGSAVAARQGSFQRRRQGGDGYLPQVVGATAAGGLVQVGAGLRQLLGAAPSRIEHRDTRGHETFKGPKCDMFPKLGGRPKQRNAPPWGAVCRAVHGQQLVQSGDAAAPEGLVDLEGHGPGT
eukprot:SAG31_NODE_2930_length_4898_cov_3.710356_3_plen_151_part_00